MAVPRILHTSRISADLYLLAPTPLEPRYFILVESVPIHRTPSTRTFRLGVQLEESLILVM